MRLNLYADDIVLFWKHPPQPPLLSGSSDHIFN